MKQVKISFIPVALCLVFFMFLHLNVAAATHPRDLTYPELTYNPPRGEDFRHTLPHGLVAYVAADPILPIIELKVLIKGGIAHDPAEKAGLTELTFHSLLAGGTTLWPGAELQEKLDLLGAALEVEVEDLTTTLHLSGMSRDRDSLLKILAEVLLHPVFESNGVEKVRAHVLQEWSNNFYRPNFVARETFKQLLFGNNHPLSQCPTASSIKKISIADMAAHYKRIVTPANVILSLAGDFDEQGMVKQLSTHLKNWQGPNPELPVIKTDPLTFTPGVYLRPMPINQGFIILGHGGIKQSDPDFAAINMMTYILGSGSFSSRIMRRVRSDEGLAYSAGAYFDHYGELNGLFKAYTQTKSVSVPFAISIIMEELRKITRTEPESEELNRAINALKDSITRYFVTKFDSMSTFAELEQNKFSLERFTRLREQYQAVTATKIMAMGKKHIRPEQMVILIVGNPDLVQKGDGIHDVILANFGKITLLPPLKFEE
ncbi:M16 family metallopeptidase [candidate division CSSED10-310 bacterium]|uniref:M16 family metallopeptidase n=1 Tax=candidate division CSSED10-310 bacterium TaxID=2855610 RepID=A0ABV6Z5K8_UNCC1